MPASPATCAATWPRFSASQASPWLVHRFSSPAGSRSGGPDSSTSISRMPVANCAASRPNWPTADVATNVTTPADDDDRLDDRDRHGRAAGHPAGEQVGQRPQQRRDQQADEHRDRDEVQAPEGDEHEVDGDGDGDRPPRVAGRDPQPVPDGLVGVAPLRRAALRGPGGAVGGRCRAPAGAGRARARPGATQAQPRRRPPAPRAGSQARHRTRFLTASPNSRGCRLPPGSLPLIGLLGSYCGA